MSFLTDLFEGNFGNLGTDITDAPQSFVNDISSEEPYLIGAGALGAGLLAPELLGGLGALGAADGAAAGAGAAAAPADLTAANSIFGAFDPASLAADAADGAGTAASTAADLSASAGTLPEADLAASAAGDGALPGSAMALQEPAAAPTLDQYLADPTLAYSDGATSPNLAGYDPTSDTYAGTTTPTAAGPAASAAPTAGAGGTPSYVNPSVSSAAWTPNAQTGLSSLNQQFGTFNPSGGGILGSLTGGIGGTNISPLTAGIAAAPLALALARGEAQLPSSAQQAQANAAVLSQYGQNNINGQLNAGQLATLQTMQQNLTTQWAQTLYNMGVTDPSKDTRWPQIQAMIDTQVTQQTATMIQNNITNALNALGAAGTQLNAIAQMQMTADQNFTNTLVNATKALGLLAGTNFTGTKTTTVTTS